MEDLPPRPATPDTPSLKPHVLNALNKQPANGSSIKGVEEFDDQTKIATVFFKIATVFDDQTKISTPGSPPAEGGDAPRARAGQAGEFDDQGGGRDECSASDAEDSTAADADDSVDAPPLAAPSPHGVGGDGASPRVISVAVPRGMLAAAGAAVALRCLAGGAPRHPSAALFSASVAASFGLGVALGRFSGLLGDAAAVVNPGAVPAAAVAGVAGSKVVGPKVAARVRGAQDLLIKQIARETAAAQTVLLARGGGEGRIVNMSQGVPCLPLFAEAQEAMSACVASGRLPYTEVAGEAACRAAAANFTNAVYGERFGPENVIITAGAIQAIYNCLAVTVEGPQDVVLTCLPAYGLYKQQTAMLGGTFATFGTGSGLPTPEALRAAFRKQHKQLAGGGRVRCVVLCLPNNPTGMALTPDAARALCDALDDMVDEHYAADPQGAFSVVLDEVYVGITAGPVVSLLQHASPRLRRSLLLVLSGSKGLGAMPGARAAWCACADPWMVEQLGKVQLCASGNASLVSQRGLAASLVHLTARPDDMRRVWRYYEARTALVASRLNGLGARLGWGPAAIVARRPEATFYVWADLSRLPRVPGKSATDVELARLLRAVRAPPCPSGEGINEGRLLVGVAAVPGSAFEMEPELLLMRFSCAVESLEDLGAAMDAVDAAVGELVCATTQRR